MAEPVVAGRFWCHMCATAVSPVGAEAGVEIKCPYCRSGFLEEMETARGGGADGGGGGGTYPRAEGVWAPIIDSMVGNPVRRRRNRRPADASTGADDDHDLDPLEFSRRRRRATVFLRLLQAIRERQLQRLESATAASGGVLQAAEHYSPFGRSLFAAGPGGEQGVALGDYFLGPGLDALMQQLTESDAGRQGTPPAKKEAVEAMPTVEVSGDAASCAVCLEDYTAGERTREMPCKHMFHAKCILPWLEMHSSCPVCRFQLPANDDSKNSCGSGIGSNSGIGDGDDSGNGDGDDSGNGNGDGHGDAGADTAGNVAATQHNGVIEEWLNSLFSQPGSSPSSASTSGSSSQHCED